MHLSLIYISTYLISESGVYASLFPRCHRQIIYAKINLKIYYPPPYEKLLWDYSKANITNIRESLSQINWVNDLRDLNVNDQVDYLTNCISNVFTNFVPNKIITCKDKYPPWITEDINNLCYNKAKIYENNIKNGRSDAEKQELASITKLSVAERLRHRSCEQNIPSSIPRLGISVEVTSQC